MSDTLRIVVPAMPWPRAAGPLQVAAPAGFERATVLCDGDAKPLPSQLARDPDGDRLWWSAPAAAAGVEQRFTAFAEDRRRRAPRRVAFTRSAFGWEVAVRGERWAELLLPAFGPPRLRVHFLGESLVSARPSAGPGAWRRNGSVQSVQGPVFGLLRATHELADDFGRTLAAVRTTWRFFDGPARRLAAELELEIAATTGPLTSTPGLTLAFADPAAAANQAGTRPALVEGPAPTQWLCADGAAATSAVMTTADAANARRGENPAATFLQLPTLSGHWPLGVQQSWRVRFLRGTDRQTARQLPAAYRDFRYPAIARVEPG